MDRRTLSTLACAVLLGAAWPAAADELTSTLGQPLVEVSHAVEVRLADGVATYVVRRTFANAGTIADEASLDIELPYGAAVTGLRIRARDRWYDGELMEREKAALLYEQLTGLGPHLPRDPALLEWVWPGRAHLYVFPVMPGGVSTVEYTLTVPTRYRDGLYVLSYPRGVVSDVLSLPVLRVLEEGGDATRRVLVDHVRLAPGTPFVLTPPVAPAWVGEGGPDPSAGWAMSAIEVADDVRTESAVLDLDIGHTYRGDLSVTLVTPAGKSVVVRKPSGGSESDVKGKFPLTFPETGSKGAWTLIVSDHAGLDVGTLNRWTLALKPRAKAGTKVAAGDVVRTARDTPVFVPDAPRDAGDPGFAVIEIAPPAIDVLTARMARFEMSPDHTLFRVEVDAAPELRPLPAGASVVFVVDASHSIGPEAIQAQLAVARAYLSHVPDAVAEVVLYRRRAERLAGKFLGPAALDEAVAAALAAGRLAPGNGSALDEGLRAAALALAKRKGPCRIVALTDALLRPAFDAGEAVKALAAAPKGTIVHVVLPELGEDAPHLTRDDRHDLAKIAKPSGGIFAHLDGLPGKPSALAPEALGLVRPIRIDDLHVEGLPAEDAGDVPATLEEGEEWRLVRTRGAAPAAITLRGKIWSSDFARVVVPSHSFAVASAGFVFSEDRFDGLTSAEMMKLAMFGRAVSPVTSYLAIEPGVRPSKIGIERGLGLLGSGAGGGGSGYGYGRGAGSLRKRPDMAALLRDGVEVCAAHAPPGWRTTLRVDTTLDEVVDVTIEAGGPHPVHACIAEVAWGVRLGPEYDHASDSFVVTFP